MLNPKGTPVDTHVENVVFIRNNRAPMTKASFSGQIIEGWEGRSPSGDRYLFVPRVTDYQYSGWDIFGFYPEQILPSVYLKETIETGAMNNWLSKHNIRLC